LLCGISVYCASALAVPVFCILLALVFVVVGSYSSCRRLGSCHSAPLWFVWLFPCLFLSFRLSDLLFSFFRVSFVPFQCFLLVHLAWVLFSFFSFLQLGLHLGFSLSLFVFFGFGIFSLFTPCCFFVIWVSVELSSFIASGSVMIIL